MARATVALLYAHGRYWTRIAPRVRFRIREWHSRAAVISNVQLRSLACQKLDDERFNVEVAAMIATTAPRAHRGRAVDAIVALQVMYDYLDALTEQPAADPVGDRLRQASALVDALSINEPPRGGYHGPNSADDGGYLAKLVSTAREALLSLPSAEVIAVVAPACAARCAEAQARVHAVGDTGPEALRQWAEQQARNTGLGWREWLFGAMGSVVGAHALIALAADDRATEAQARELDSAYLTLCVLTTALDHVVDHERDVLLGDPSYLSLYESREELANEISLVVRRVLSSLRSLASGPHHAMILAGVVAYYTSQSGAMGAFARPVTERVRDELRPLITPTLATLHTWRIAKSLKNRLIPLGGIRAGASVDLRQRLYVPRGGRLTVHAPADEGMQPSSWPSSNCHPQSRSPLETESRHADS
jgi:tetraprenyl-beta-curcumene synthase